MFTFLVCLYSKKQNNENGISPTSLNQSDYDAVSATSGQVNMTPNPAYGNNSSIKMEENPAYRCLEE